jgi:CRISPR/Cas system-associated endonuclease Cas1
MHGIVVDLKTGKARQVQHTPEMEAAALKQAKTWEAEQEKTREAEDAETMIREKIREQAVTALVSEGKMTAEGLVKKAVKAG